MASARRSELAEVTEVDGLRYRPAQAAGHARPWRGAGNHASPRAIVERATDAGREVAVADARDNATLGSSEERHPTRVATRKTVTDGPDELTNQQAETVHVGGARHGGGDQVFNASASSLEPGRIAGRRGHSSRSPWRPPRAGT